MLKIGLTGGIGSGKTTAADYFAELGAEVIDTDLLSRELVEPGRPALAEIVAAFSPAVLDGAGRLNRARLRDRIAAVERTVEQQQIVDERLVDRDVFGLARDGGEVELQVLHVRDGRVVGAAEYGFSDVRIDDGDVVVNGSLTVTNGAGYVGFNGGDASLDVNTGTVNIGSGSGDD